LAKTCEEKLVEARGIAVDLLQMNYKENQPYVISIACGYFDHQVKRTSGLLCICGHVKYGVKV
jgi:hypothetical protein